MEVSTVLKKKDSSVDDDMYLLFNGRKVFVQDKLVIGRGNGHNHDPHQLKLYLTPGDGDSRIRRKCVSIKKIDTDYYLYKSLFSNRIYIEYNEEMSELTREPIKLCDGMKIIILNFAYMIEVKKEVSG